MKTRSITTLLVAAALGLLLSGCATNEYAKYSEGQAKIEAARANADAAKYKALSDIAASGDTTAKVAAVVALTSMQSQQQGGAQLRAPQASSALQWAQILVPGLTQMTGIWASTRLGMRQSDNSARVAESTNSTFLGMAGKIQSPAANVTNTTTTTDSRQTDNSTYATTDSRVTDNSQRADSSNHDSGNVTTTRTSSVGDFSGSNSGNSGRIAGGDQIDSTSTPTVVMQPAPLVVNQPAPVVVMQPAPVIVPPAQ